MPQKLQKYQLMCSKQTISWNLALTWKKCFFGKNTPCRPELGSARFFPSLLRKVLKNWAQLKLAREIFPKARLGSKNFSSCPSLMSTTIKEPQEIQRDDGDWIHHQGAAKIWPWDLHFSWILGSNHAGATSRFYLRHRIKCLWHSLDGTVFPIVIKAKNFSHFKQLTKTNQFDRRQSGQIGLLTLRKGTSWYFCRIFGEI